MVGQSMLVSWDGDGVFSGDRQLMMHTQTAETTETAAT